MPYKDKEKQKEYQKQWARNKYSTEKALEERREIRRAWRENNRNKINKYNTLWRKTQKGKINLRKARVNRKYKKKEWLNKLKENSKCSRCGESHPATLDFHHKNPKEKVADVAYMLNTGHTLKIVRQEVEKCDILCSNCHRILHWESQQKK